MRSDPERSTRPAPRRRGVAVLAAILAALALGTATGAAADEGPAPALQPFTATYAVEWKGITAGSARLVLSRQGEGRYGYRSLIAARGLFRLVFPGDISQSSTFELVDGAIRPLSYRATDGASDHARDVALDFDWAANRVSGTAETHPVAVELRPGTLDPMSVQIAMMRTLAAEHAPTHFLMIEKSEIADYLYAREGAARLTTALGELDTVIWSSRRNDSDRVTRMWYAPALGFVPVRAERTRRGKVELEMTIRALTHP